MHVTYKVTVHRLILIFGRHKLLCHNNKNMQISTVDKKMK